MILGVQILGTLFGLFMAYITFLHYKRREFSKTKLLIWEFFWFALIFLTLFPQSMSRVVEKLSIERAIDLYVILGFMLLAFLTFYNYLTLNKIKQKMEKLTREQALNTLK